MGYYLSFPILIIAVALQTGLLPAFRLYAGQPELVLLIVVAWAIHAEWEEAVFWAFLGGILQDLLAVTPTGTSVIALVLMVFGIKWISGGLYQFAASQTRPQRAAAKMQRLSILQRIIRALRNTFFASLLLFAFTALGTVTHHIVLLLVLGLTGYPTDIPEMIQFFTLPTLAYNLAGILPVYIVLRRIQKRIPTAQSAWDVSPRT